MMQFEVFFAVVFLAFLSGGSALTCNHCGSRERWSMCDNNLFQRECKPWEDRCYKASVDTTYNGQKITRFVKGCTTEKQCFDHSMDDCRTGENKAVTLPCEVHCCGGHRCNPASIPWVSGVVLVSCALLAVLFQ
ncbi:uncharacterized protein LOC110237657 [Exaiptasia diaphana]|uniref:Uncharacterized protein n=1 Tax=Exaiptasia diaphana TaxID=2652724 RepID=A0A913X4R9_EXADI|nr:uncharacterized protein LOC110237657 [Exaiptasia diaphana]KXJ27067.1 hypothetical protein AC249_AIPGENE13674 [Exaiptasia diaphana]